MDHDPGTDAHEMSGRRRPEEIELLNDGEEIDASALGWAPGEPPPGEPTDEILHVHELTASEPSADLLEIPEDGLEIAEPDVSEAVVEAAEPESQIEAALTRTFLSGHDLEPRYGRFDEEDAGLAGLEHAAARPSPGEFVCARCHLRKDHAQLADPERGLCRDCVDLA
jgi:hypothetical protein